jgi:hypothetical protein
VVKLLIEEGKLLGEDVVIDEVRGLVRSSVGGRLTEEALLGKVKALVRAVRGRKGRGAG